MSGPFDPANTGDETDDDEIDGTSVALAIATGFATFLVVAIGVAELGHEWLPVPILVGLLVGAVAGAVATAVVTAGLTGDVPSRQRRLAGGFGGYTVGFFLGAVAASWLLSLDVVSSLVVGVGIGIVGAVWGSQQGLTSESES